MNKKTFEIILRVLIVVGITMASFIFIYYLFKLTYPFIIAAFLVVLVNPLINFLEKKAKLPRLLAVLTTLLLFFSGFAGLMTLLIAEIISGTAYLANILPAKITAMINTVQAFLIYEVVPFYEDIASKFNSLDPSKQNTIISSIKEASNKLSESAISFLQTFLTGLPALISWIPSAATAIVFIFLATFLIGKDWDEISKKFNNHLPSAIKKASGHVLKDFKKAGFGFIRAQIILITISFIIALIGLVILQVNHALTIAIIMGIVDIIPIIGISLIIIPWAIYEFAIGNLYLAIGLSILFIVVTAFRRILEPKVLASSLDLDPLATLIALFVGFQLFGFLGLILGPLFLIFGITLKRTGVFSDIYQYIVQPKKK